MANILLIDDEKSIRKTLREILEYEGYVVDEAGDGAEGFRMIQEGDYDIVLCDIKMPKMDGMEVLEKAQVAHADVPFIMISGHGTLETAVEAVKKGAFDYVAKPPDLNRLLITIRNALDKSNLITETGYGHSGSSLVGLNSKVVWHAGSNKSRMAITILPWLLK